MEKHAFVNFSHHAFDRLVQRTSLSSVDIAAILDNGLYVNTGSKPGIHKDHLVFYSRQDDDYFVAIKDTFTGTIITILPLEYQKELAWEISPNDCQRAKDIVIAATPIEKSAPRKSVARKPAPQVTPPSMFYISGHYFDEHGNQKTKGLVRIPSAPYNHDATLLLLDATVIETIKQSAVERGIDVKRLFSATARYGMYGEPVVIELLSITSSRPKDGFPKHDVTPDGFGAHLSCRANVVRDGRYLGAGNKLTSHSEVLVACFLSMDMELFQSIRQTPTGRELILLNRS